MPFVKQTSQQSIWLSPGLQYNDAKQLRQKSSTTYVNAYTVQALYLSSTKLYLTNTKLYLLRK